MKTDLRLEKGSQNRSYFHAWPSNFKQVYDVSRRNEVLQTCYETLIVLPSGIIGPE